MKFRLNSAARFHQASLASTKAKPCRNLKRLLSCLKMHDFPGLSKRSMRRDRRKLANKHLPDLPHASSTTNYPTAQRQYQIQAQV